MRFPGFIGPSYTLQSVNVDCQRCVNMFPEVNALGTGKEHEVAFLAPTPGLKLLLTLPSGPVRGLWRASNDQFFAVGADKFYSISSSWVATELGTLLTTTGPVSMADNGLAVVIVDGPNGYSWTIATNTFAQITDPDFLGADQVTFQDGYLLFNKPDSQQFYWTDINALTFDALDIATAEGRPDNLVGLVNHNQNLFLFGKQTIEVYYNSGDANSTWQRTVGAVLGVGCSAPFSIARGVGSLFWVGGDESGQGIVYKASGLQASKISTPSIESVIRSISVDDLQNATAFVYQQGGHVFYCLNLPGVDSSWVYDDSTGLWHERAYLNLWNLERHRADCHAVAFGKNVVGDYQNGKIYELDQNTYTDNGVSISRIRTAPHITKELKFARHSRFQLDMDVGVGLDGTTQGTNPQAVLQWSDDGGHSWSNERWADIGKIGKTKTRVIWRRLGLSRDRVYRVTITDPVKVALIGADLLLEEGLA